MSKSIDVLIVGAVNDDVYVNHAANPEESTHVDYEIRTQTGGGAAITAIALAKFGMNVALVASLGIRSQNIEADLEDAGVMLSAARYNVPQATTVAEHKDGIKTYRANTLSNEMLTPDDLYRLTSPLLKDAEFVMRTGYPWMKKIAGRPTRDFFNEANKQGSWTVLDMSNPDRWPTGMLEYLREEVRPHTGILCGNVQELYRVIDKLEPIPFNSDTVEADMEHLVQSGTFYLNIHCGAEGTLLMSTPENDFIPAQPVTETRTPTGNGNIQNAGVIYGIANEWSLREIGAFANTAAALRLDGTADYPTVEQIQNRAALYPI